MSDLPQENNVHIFIAEQNDTEPFNRGRSRNIAFDVCNKHLCNNLTNVIFEDVDTWPKTTSIIQKILNHNNDNEVLHVYGEYIALTGIWVASKEILIKSNGFPNDFIYWGQEDDVIFNRIKDIGITISKPYHRYAMYDSQNINPDIDEDTKHDRKITNMNHEKLKRWRSNPTGISNLDYTIKYITYNKLLKNLYYNHVYFI